MDPTTPTPIRRMRIMCFVPSIRESNAFPVDYDRDQMVADLKDKIKEKMHPKLKDYMANSLVLYRVAIDEALDHKRRIEELERLYKDKEWMRLDEWGGLSNIFGENPPEGRIYCIIVYIPEGESIYY